MDSLPPNFDWADAATRLVRGELAREKLTLAELAQRLRALGLEETEGSVKNKLHRGTFSAAFLLQCLAALDRTRLDVDSLLPKAMPRGRDLDA